MSEFYVNTFKIDKVDNHPNADRLEFVKYGGYSIVVAKGIWSPGDWAVYIPIDSILPREEKYSFLIPPKDEHGTPKWTIENCPENTLRIKAKKLRGIMSSGILVPIPPGINPEDWVERSLHEEMGITKWDGDNPEHKTFRNTGGTCEAMPRHFHFNCYTSLEHLKKRPFLLQEGEEVVILEKIHGANSRYIWDSERDRLWVGSKSQVKDAKGSSIWTSAARGRGLGEKVKKHPDHIFFGEVYGKVQNLNYGVGNSVDFLVFDIGRPIADGMNEYLNWDDVVKICNKIDLPTAPVLYRGPWTGDERFIRNFSEGLSTLCDSHIREGFVVKPVVERVCPRFGRVALKFHGDSYLTQKGKKK